MRTCAAPTIFRHSEPMGHANVRPMAGSPSNFAAVQEWIASSLALLAMTISRAEQAAVLAAVADFRRMVGTVHEGGFDERQRLWIGTLRHQKIEALTKHLFPVVPC
jgi:hypothetical protein